MGVVLPQVGPDLKGKDNEFCPRCQCKNENRNTTIIKVVVIIVIWVISILVIYMLFLIILDPLLNKRVKGSYQEHTNEEVCSLLHSSQIWVIFFSFCFVKRYQLRIYNLFSSFVFFLALILPAKC